MRRASEEVDQAAVSKKVTHTKDVRETVGKGVDLGRGKSELICLGSTVLGGVNTAGVSCGTAIPDLSAHTALSHDSYPERFGRRKK